MKDMVREAVFDLLGPASAGTHALDLFAGTGALGLEAVSRGASRATFIERHRPTAAVLRRNIAALGVADICELVIGDVFSWWRSQPALGPGPWLVFCSPPYDYYVDRCEDTLGLLRAIVQRAPSHSVVVVESDRRFDPAQLPHPDAWDIRRYGQTVIALWESSPTNR